MTLYIASTNPGKLRDFAHAACAGITLRLLPGLADLPAPPEDEPTFEGNARAKAVAYSLHAPGLLVLADDSGLEVDTLNGAPGVRSARFADDHAFPLQAPTDQRNNACLLQALANTENSPARYQCVLALARDGRVLHTAAGSVEGLILSAPRGIGGFGYDPLFLLPKENLTMAEISPEIRARYSHRARALSILLHKIAQPER